MKKSLSVALFLSVSFSAFAIASNLPETTDSNTSSGAYTLNPDVETYKLDTSSLNTEVDTPKIVKEQLKDGSTVEKLVAPDGKVIAEKTIKDGEVISKVLNYYYPTGQLSRRVTTIGENGGFYAEDYYKNGKISSQANYVNEENKIGKEKKYDSTGTLRQEISWGLPQKYAKKPLSEQKTIRYGSVLSYYPDGRLAASFAIGEKGKNIFYNRHGRPIKIIPNAELLNFAPELKQEDCLNNVIKLSLEELVELYEDEGDISYNKCGLPYRENFKNEITDIRGNLAIRVSYDETGMIRRIATYVGGQKNGVEQKFDASGNLTAEINYKKGVKSGTASGYFPNREVAFRKRYEDGKVVGALTCYFPTGEKAAEFNYKDGKKEGVSKIYGPQAREIMFVNDEISEQSKKDTEKRYVAPSKLSELETQSVDAKCLDLEDKIENLNLELDANTNTVTKTFTLDIPYSCQDFSSFKPKNSNYACYDANNTLRSVLPTSYNRGEYAMQTIYSVKGKILYHIPYMQKQKQGFAHQYDEKNKIVSEIYFDKDELAESSRSYYDNGTVREIYTVSDGADRKLYARYGKDGDLEFNLNYNKGKRVDGFLSDTSKNKDIYIKFYQDKIDNIREVNAENPYNYIEYNLALGEYTVYKDNKLIKGGKICGYENISPDVQIIQPIKPISEVVKTTATVVPSTAQQASVKAPETTTQSTALQASVKAPETTTPNTAPQASVKTPETIAPSTALQTVAKVPEVATTTISNQEEYEELSPILPEEAAPMVEGLEPISFEDFSGQNAIIPTSEEKRQAELAAKNIGPVATPGIDELADVVSKERLETSKIQETETKPKTEKFYYPNGSIRKSITTRGGRTDRIKEYSKNGLLITDTIYQDEGILTEKYYGSGQIRRKIHKSYSDDPILAFTLREDFYDNGNMRYTISRQPDTILFIDKDFYTDGALKRETKQNGALSFTITEYTKDGNVSKVTEQQGTTTLVKEYGPDNSLKSFSLNGSQMPVTMAKNSADIMQDNSKIYTSKSVLKSEFKAEKQQNILKEYYPDKTQKSEVSFLNNGEIYVKLFAKDGTLEKFAYLSSDGKLYIQKPEMRVIPSYRERYWIDYNNPRWIENQDKYSIKNIARLSLDTAAYIFAEIDADVPELMQKLYDTY